MSLPTTSKLLLTVTVALAMTATAGGAAPSAQTLPQAGAVVGTLPIPPSYGVLFAPRGRSLFVVDFPQSRVTTIEVLRVNADRTITRNRVRFDLPDYLADLSAGPDGLYAGTAVIKRFTKRRDELVRIDANTLSVRKRVFFPASVAALERGRRMWASLGDGRVLRLDPRTLAIDASRRVLSAAARARGAIVSKPAVGLGSLWVLAGDERDLRFVRMNPITLAIRSTTRIPTNGDLAQALSSVVADSGHVYLVGHAIAAVDATGSLIGRPVLVADLETAAIYGNGLVGLTNGKPALVLLDQHGKLLARTTLRDGGGQLAVSGQNAWFLGDGGKGEGIVHVRLSDARARTRALASRSRTSALRCPKLVTR